jgi:hypothetical protein
MAVEPLASAILVWWEALEVATAPIQNISRLPKDMPVLFAVG